MFYVYQIPMDCKIGRFQIIDFWYSFLIQCLSVLNLYNLNPNKKYSLTFVYIFEFTWRLYLKRVFNIIVLVISSLNYLNVFDFDSGNSNKKCIILSSRTVSWTYTFCILCILLALVPIDCSKLSKRNI